MPSTDSLLPPDRRRVFLIRHGEVDYFDPSGAPVDPRQTVLSERGRAQADALRIVLAGEAIDRLICSGLPRTKETAVAVFPHLAARIEEETDLREIKAGRLREVPPGERKAALAGGFDRAAEPSAAFVGGESFEAFEARVLGAFRRLIGAPE